MAGFINSIIQSASTTTTINNSDNDIAAAFEDLEKLLTVDEFVEIDSDTPVFNEWTNMNDDLIVVVNEDCGDNTTTENNEDYDMSAEAPPKLTEALEYFLLLFEIE
ncbi:hypothetical protein I4U23_022766 [Adineta vaga]|nr:hypothetical protein I4U23_022766 [Adineta vaga]